MHLPAHRRGAELIMGLWRGVLLHVQIWASAHRPAPRPVVATPGIHQPPSPHPRDGFMPRLFGSRTLPRRHRIRRHLNIPRPRYPQALTETRAFDGAAALGWFGIRASPPMFFTPLIERFITLLVMSGCGPPTVRRQAPARPPPGTELERRSGGKIGGFTPGGWLLNAIALCQV